ncbi:MAG: hypothetical protein IPP67_03845 [Rhodospirillaceae bacterium]|nr:hypothetical protein [Rhodospirillaceae bacterium]
MLAERCWITLRQREYWTVSEQYDVFNNEVSFPLSYPSVKTPRIKRSFDDPHRQENISTAFRQALHQHYHKHYSPEQILGYIYAMLHSPTYRHRYKGFLKSDFPRIPLVKTPDIFEELSTLGWQLVQAHLMREIPNHPKITLSPGDYLVEKPLYQAEKQRLYINRTLYVEAVSPEVGISILAVIKCSINI